MLDQNVTNNVHFQINLDDRANKSYSRIMVLSRNLFYEISKTVEFLF